MLPWNDEELRVGMFEVDDFYLILMTLPELAPHGALCIKWLQTAFGCSASAT